MESEENVQPLPPTDEEVLPISLCANCITNGDSTTLKSSIQVKSIIVKVYEALNTIYGPTSFSTENTECPDDFWQLCTNCSNALSQLYDLYLHFKELGRDGSRIDIARTKPVVAVEPKEEPLSVLPDSARLRRRILRDRRPPPPALSSEIDPDTSYPLSVKQETALEESDNERIDDDDWVPPSPEISFHTIPPKKRGRPKSYNISKKGEDGKKRGRPRRKRILNDLSISKKDENFINELTVGRRQRRSIQPIILKEDSGSEGEDHPRHSKEVEDDSDGNNSDSNRRKKRGRPRGSKKYGGLLPKVKLHEDKTYECPECKKKSKSMRNLHIHIRGVHEGLRPYPCHICKRQFAGKDGLKNHLRVTHGEKGSEEVRKYICEEPGCGKSFAYSAVLRAHRFTHNKDELRFICPTCGRKYRSNHDMQRHMTVHTDEKPIVCDQCGGTFKTNSNLAQHQRFVHPDVFGGLPLSKLSCPVCLKTFMTPGNMRQHVRSVHERVKPHQCQLCEKQFSCSSNLKVHLKGFHKQGKDISMNMGFVPPSTSSSLSSSPSRSTILMSDNNKEEEVKKDIIPMNLVQNHEIIPLQETIQESIIPITNTSTLSTVDSTQFQHYSFPPFFHNILPPH